MKRQRRLVQWVTGILLSLFMTACPQLTVRHVDTFPADRFDHVQARLAALERARQDGRSADELCLLVYDGASGELVDMHLPLSVVAWGLEAGMAVSDEEEGAAGKLHHACDPFRDLSADDLKHLGPGLLVQVEDAEENARVWIWLE